MNLFLLFCVPTLAIVIVWKYLLGVKPPQPILFYSSSIAWGLGALAVTFPLRGLALFTGDFGMIFFGIWLNNGFLGPGLLLAAYFWRHRKDPDQRVLLFRLTLWLASYFTFLSLSDFSTTRIDEGIPELFVNPLTWSMVIALLPILYLHFISETQWNKKLLWAVSAVGLGFGIAFLTTVAFSPWAWVSWILTTASILGVWQFLERFYVPLQNNP